MKICVDLDGVICTLKKKGETYADVKLKPGVQETLKKYKDEGHYIIIQTARHMKTCESNIGLVNKRITKITLDWLDDHNIEYDEIYFGKPWCDVYIDDNAYRFEGWDKIQNPVEDLPLSSENRKI
jgi:capsule biosynthesis phosphatase